MLVKVFCNNGLHLSATVGKSLPEVSLEIVIELLTTSKRRPAITYFHLDSEFMYELYVFDGF